MKRAAVLMMAVILLLPAISAAYDVKYEYWVISGKGGIAYPVDVFGDFNNLGFSGNISARKGLDMEVSVGGSIGFNNMPYKADNAPTPFSALILNGEIVYAPYLPDFFVWPYMKAGLGIYIVDFSRLAGIDNSVKDSATTLGFVLGGGVNYPLTNELLATVEVLYNHAAFDGGQSNVYTFFTFNAGVSYFLK